MTRGFYIKLIFIFCLTGFLTLLFINLDAEGVSDKDYIIGAEDLIDIQVWGHQDLHRTVEISKEGDFSFPLIGKVHGAGLSVFELENLLKKRLADGYLINPHVTVTVTKYSNQEVFLLGEVRKPGRYILKGKTHLVELLSEAGGFTALVGETITIVRPKSPKQKSGPISPEKAKENEIITLDIDQLTAGGTEDEFFVVGEDSIYVLKAQRIFVIGEVRRTGELKWESGLTVREVISMAGGHTQKGAIKRTKIIRTENGIEREFKPQMSDLVKPDDIIKVPESYF